MVSVTCRTEGCENADVTFLLNDPGDLVICGPCGVPITDKQDHSRQEA